jgi:hypothetical protein
MGKIAFSRELQGELGVNSIEIQQIGVLEKAKALHVSVGDC